MQAVLVMFRSDGERRSFSITRDMTVIGRREDCDLRIPLGDVSRKHCRLVREDGGLRIEDLGSSNGTYHNGHRIEKEAQLGAGDSIQVGPVVFVLQLDGVPADEDLHPVTSDAAAMGYAPGHAVSHAPPEPPAEPGAGNEFAADDAGTGVDDYATEHAAAGGDGDGGGGDLDELASLDEDEVLPAGHGGDVEVIAGPGVEELEPLPLDGLEAAHDDAPPAAAAAPPKPAANAAPAGDEADDDLEALALDDEPLALGDDEPLSLSDEPPAGGPEHAGGAGTSNELDLLAGEEHAAEGEAPAESLDDAAFEPLDELEPLHDDGTAPIELADDPDDKPAGR